MSDFLTVSYLAVGPEILLTVGAVLVLMIDVFRKPSARVHAWLVAATLLAATVVTWFQWDRVAEEGPFLAFSNMVVIDGYGVIASFILLLVGALGLAAGRRWSGQAHFPHRDQSRRTGYPFTSGHRAGSGRGNRPHRL